MTEQEAIEIIKYASAFNSDNSPLMKALDMAMNALEKQIPKKPIKHIAEQDWYECTACGAYDVYEQGYCDECGQKLDNDN